MNKVFSTLLDRLAERFAALMAGSLSSRVEGLHAAVQADQQSQLEDLARTYEADGKTDIAATLRKRAARLTSADLAAEATEVIDHLTDAPQRLSEPATVPPSQKLRAIPDFGVVTEGAGKRRRKTTEPAPIPDDPGAIS